MMSEQLNEFLQTISADAVSSSGYAADAEPSEEAFSADLAGGGAALALAAGVIRTIEVPVANGHGELTSDKQTTAWVTISGSGTVVSPGDGTWNITVTDLVAGKTVFQASNLPANKQVDFSYKTGWSTQLKIVADWSKKANTTLQLRLDTNH